MKNLILAILLVLGISVASAKDKDGKAVVTEDNTTLAISGTVADVNSGEVLVGVEIKIEGTDLKTYTDFDGNFSFKNVKPGEYKLVANYISYQENTEILNLSSRENDLKIKLQTSDY